MAIPDTLPGTREPVIPGVSVDPDAAVEHERRTGRWRQFGYRLGTFFAGSAVSTLISQATLTGLYWLGGTSATTAAVMAFIAGAIPNFILNWRWTWHRKGRPALVREILPYVLISVGGGFAAAALTTVADNLVSPILTSRGEQTIVLDLVYLGSYGLLFLVKFALLDRVLSDQQPVADAARVPVDAR